MKRISVCVGDAGFSQKTTHCRKYSSERIGCDVIALCVGLQPQSYN